MKLYQVTYTDNTNTVRRQFASSDAAASQLSTKLKADGTAEKRPERESIDVPTDKNGLIIWLNENVGVK